jgi:hypothetical protein
VFHTNLYLYGRLPINCVLVVGNVKILTAVVVDQRILTSLSAQHHVTFSRRPDRETDMFRSCSARYRDCGIACSNCEGGDKLEFFCTSMESQNK